MTSRIAYPAVIVLTVWLTYVAIGFRRQGGWGFLRNVMSPPGLPEWIHVIVAPLELVHIFVTRPFTLSVRLFANMTSFVVVVVLPAFELFIQGLQAYIFTLLAASYIASSLEAGH